LQNTKKLDISPRYKFISEKHIITLLIYELVPEDAGLYEVRVTNSAGTNRSTANITVQKPRTPLPTPPSVESAPEVLQPLKPDSVEEGKPVTLQCTIKGAPGMP